MTEKDYNPNQKEKKAMKKQPKKVDVKVAKNKIKLEKEEETNLEREKSQEENKEVKEEPVKIQESEKTKEKKSTKKIKKEEVCVNAKSVPVSTKYAINICKFIKGKRIEKAMSDLEEVNLLKKAVPMKGEYSHRKGKGMGGGSFPKRASKHFIVLLKSLAGNANNHEIDNPIIFETSANWATGPRGKFGRVRRKRTHITLKAKEMKRKENKK